jgi:outer membrane lipoprotein SlyB
MRKLLMSVSIIAGVALAGCASTDQPNGVAVQGYQAPGGWGVVAEQKVAVQADVAPGQSAYMGASADGSLVGFIFADGTVRWYKTAAR